MVADDDQQTRQYLLARFWEAALGFWRKGGGRTSWVLTLTVITIALVHLGLQYRLNVWHRAMFDALDKREVGARRQCVVQARHHHWPVHPVKTLASSDQRVWWFQPRIFGGASNPADVGRIATWQRPASRDHPR